MMENNWYDQARVEHFSNADKPRKRTFSLATLVVCMLVTAMVGGAFGSIIAIGGRGAQSANTGLPAATQPQETPKPSAAEQKPDVNVAYAPALNANNTYTKAQIVEMTAHSIVGIDIQADLGRNYYGQDTIATGSGSGVIISADGYIATNNHVVEGAQTIKVYLWDDTEYEAKLVATDAKTDIAVIKVEASNLQPVIMGDSDALVVGEDVIAIGNPLGELRGTATSGMVSALSRTIYIQGQNLTLLQTDAAINPGNSGGGLFNAKAQLIGIVNAKVASEMTEGLGFAIPVNSVKQVTKDLIDLGYVSGRAYLGVYPTEVFINTGNGDGRGGLNIDGFFGYFNGRGAQTRVRVNDVVPGGAADKAGIKAGDILLKVGDTEIRSSSDLSAAIGEYKVGDVAMIRVQREEKEEDISVTFGEYVPTKE